MLPTVPPVLVAYAAAVVLPALLAWRAWLAAGEGRASPSRAWKILAFGVPAALVGVTLLTPWRWTWSLPLHTYGLMIALGFVSAIVVAARAADRGGLDKNHVLDMSFWVLLAGLIGARLLFVLVNPEDYFGDRFLSWVEIGGRRIVKLPSLLIFWKGGLVFYGGLIGGFLGVVWYLRKHRLPFFPYADAMVLGLPLAHFFGRLGCFAAGCCWGKTCPTDSPFATYFPQGSLVFSQTPPDTHMLHAGEWTTVGLYPTQLFESLAVLLVFGGLLVLRRHKRFHGQLLITYLVAYPLVRTVIETFRGDWERGLLFRWPAEDPVLLSTSQIISVGVAALGITFIAQRLGRIRKAEADKPGESRTRAA